METREEYERSLDKFISEVVTPEGAESYRTISLEMWDKRRAEFDQQDQSYKANALEIAESDIAELFPKEWNELGLVTKSIFNAAAFFFNVRIDKVTAQEKLDSIIKISDLILPKILKENEHEPETYSQLTAYQIALNYLDLGNTFTKHEVLKFVENGKEYNPIPVLTVT